MSAALHFCVDVLRLQIADPAYSKTFIRASERAKI